MTDGGGRPAAGGPRLGPLFPHEVVATVFVVAGIAALENLPVTYSRGAILLAYARVLALALLIALPVIWLASRVRRPAADGETALARAATFVRLGAVLGLALSVHFLLKSFIHLFNPANFDAALATLDVRLHLGVDPGAVATAAITAPWTLRLVDAVYSFLYYWVIVVHLALLLALPPLRTRLRFTLAFLLLWVVGAAVYVALPSWGPVFVHPERFAGALEHMPLTVSMQGALYDELASLVHSPLAPRLVRYGSVAAFPSLHVAVVGLFAIASRRLSRTWFLLALAILAVMVVGSVLTGYHYLVDAEAGMALAAGAWWVAGRIHRDAAIDSQGAIGVELASPRRGGAPQ